MKLFLVLAFVCSSQFFFAQGEANNWYFGFNAGLNFGTTPPSVLTDGQLNTLEGCTTISDATGQLLFYTDGSNVYNKNHRVMPNGFGLKGDESSTSSALIVPQPNTNGIYIIFTVDEPHHFNADSDPLNDDNDGVNDGLMYSVVDMTLDGGNGDVIASQKNIPLITYDTSDSEQNLYKCSEKITAVKSENCSAFWIITHFIDSFYAFIVDETGVNNSPVISRTGVTIPISGYRRNALGYLKASPEGDQLAAAHLGVANVTGADGPGKVVLYDFDNTTGIVSNEIELYNGDAPYGVEFSQSGNKLYATVGLSVAGINNGFVIQYDLTQPNNQIAASGTRLSNENGQTTSIYSAGALQLGPDGRIYRALFDFRTGIGDYLGIIENPEEIASNVVYRDQGILVNVDGSRSSAIGLPPFIQSIFAETIDVINDPDINTVNLNLCQGDTYQLSYDDIPSATYTWYVDDILTTNTSNFFDVNTDGNYRLEVDLNDGSCTKIGVANVTYLPVPVVSPIATSVCDDDSDNITILSLTDFDTQVLNGQDSDIFQVRYFSNEMDAQSGTNPITNSFTNENNPQELFFRIENQQNIDCFAVEQLTITIFSTPSIPNETNIYACDDNSDGNSSNRNIMFDIINLVNTFLLSDSSNLVNFYQISVHLSLDDAENNNNSIPNPDNYELFDEDQVFVRFQNPTNPNCYKIKDFTFFIDALPEANDTTLIQCDPYIIPDDGITVFNLNESIPSITNNTSDVTVTFYEDQALTRLIGNTETYQNDINSPQVFAQVLKEHKNSSTEICSNIATITLEINTNMASDAILMECDNTNTFNGFVSFDLTQAREQILEGINSPNLTVTYYATINDALLENNAITTITNTTPYTQGDDIVYARVEQNGNQCYAINQIALFVNQLPVIEEDTSITHCEGETITIDAGLPSTANSTDFQFNWLSGETTESIVINRADTYFVSVTSLQTGCSSTRTIQVLPSSPATITNVNIIDGASTNLVTITTTGLGDYEYALVKEETQVSMYQDDNTFRNIIPGFYTIYVRDKNGCLPITTRQISVVGFPQYFTPNGDHYHPTWNIQGISEQLLTGSEIFIFDRSGTMIKKLFPGESGWDGTYNGKQMPSSEYWYVANLSDGRTLKGSFSLIR